MAWLCCPTQLLELLQAPEEELLLQQMLNWANLAPENFKSLPDEVQKLILSQVKAEVGDKTAAGKGGEASESVGDAPDGIGADEIAAAAAAAGINAKEVDTAAKGGSSADAADASGAAAEAVSVKAEPSTSSPDRSNASNKRKRGSDSDADEVQVVAAEGATVQQAADSAVADPAVKTEPEAAPAVRSTRRSSRLRTESTDELENQKAKKQKADNGTDS